jgi:hypothetical protein
MTLQAMWVHGNTIVPERTIKAEPVGTDGPLTDIPGVPGSGMLGFRRGGGATFRGKDNHDNWFHFSIPTPVIHEGVRARLLKVFVLFNSDPTVSVTDVHVWDGIRERIFEREMPTGVTGRHDGADGLSDLAEDFTQWTLPDQPQIYWGVGISVRVFFADEGQITFTSAGADFEV